MTDGEKLDAGCSDDVDPVENYYKTMADFYNRKEGSLNLIDGYNCQECKNRGYTMVAEKNEFGYWQNMEYECKCQKIRRTIRRIEKSGMKATIKAYTIQKYQTGENWQREVKEKALRYIQERMDNPDSDKWFYIGGETGSGKTHICTAICRELMLRGKSVQYMPWRDDSVTLKSMLGDMDGYQKKMQELKTIDVLYIDDLFKTGALKGEKQKPTAADINLAFELLNYRYNNPRLVTIISSECTLNDLLDIDEAIGGRIAERSMGYAISLGYTGKKNYRKRFAG